MHKRVKYPVNQICATKYNISIVTACCICVVCKRHLSVHSGNKLYLFFFTLLQTSTCDAELVG